MSVPSLSKMTRSMPSSGTVTRPRRPPRSGSTPSRARAEHEARLGRERDRHVLADVGHLEVRLVERVERDDDRRLAVAPVAERTRMRTIEPRKLMSSTVPWSRFEPSSPSPSAIPLGPERERDRPSARCRRRRPCPSGPPGRRSTAGPSTASMTPAATRLSVPTNEATNAVAREVVDLGRRADLLDPAVAHDDDPVGQRERLLLVVGHVDRRDPELALDRPDLLAQDDPDLGVERRQRLVEEQDLRLDGERAGERDALLLAARQLVRVAVALVRRGG